ncbi:MAG: imidazole glycerol phosphate synthase subunit HisH [bacterium]|nr:imidazole glycerol phosphate synthase subunit HisH [bacterium]
MLALIDYGMGNLCSVKKAFIAAGSEDIEIVNEPSRLTEAHALILPGVGNFGDGIKNLVESGFAESIIHNIDAGKPFIGICLGMQLLMEKSEEAPNSKGLGVFKGKSIRFSDNMNLKVPHIGWNSVEFKRPNKYIDNLIDNEYFYFVHSYFVEPKDPAITLGTTEYGINFSSCIGKDNVFATQFHPEKSQDAGLNMIKSFIDNIKK